MTKCERKFFNNSTLHSFIITSSQYSHSQSAQSPPSQLRLQVQDVAGCCAHVRWWRCQPGGGPVVEQTLPGQRQVHQPVDGGGLDPVPQAERGTAQAVHQTG